MSLYRDNRLKDQEDERSLGNFFTRINFLHFATETSPRCSSLRVHISGIHCYNPNAGLVRQKAGMEALIVFIGSPVTGDPVLDIAWQHQNHEKSDQLGQWRAFLDACTPTLPRSSQSLARNKCLIFLASCHLLAIPRWSNMIQDFPPCREPMIKNKESIWLSWSSIQFLAFQTRDHSFASLLLNSLQGLVVFPKGTLRTRFLSSAQQLVRLVLCSGGRIPANPKVLVERAWRSLHKNRRHWPNAQKNVGLSLRLGFFEETGTDWYNLSMIYTHSSRPHVHQWSPVVIAWQLDFMGPVGWVPCSNRQPSCVNDDPVARWGMWQGCSMLYWNSTCMTCLIYIRGW